MRLSEMKDEPNAASGKFAFIGGTCVTRDRKENGDSSKRLTVDTAFPLAKATRGDRLWIVDLQEEKNNPYLHSLGLIPGNAIEILSRTPRGSVLICSQHKRIGLGAELANLIMVTNMSIFLEPRAIESATVPTVTHLRELPVGTKACVVGYDKIFSGYTGKLLAMGLSPGTEFTLIRHASPRTPLQIQVRDCLMSLGKPESEALCVEELEG